MMALLAAAAIASPLKTSACRVGQTHAAAICGTYTVFEDRGTHAGRTIPIRFVDIKAKRPSKRAVVFNPGGPGVSAADMAGDFADATSGIFATLHQTYDILLVDNRGTGGSAQLQCAFDPPAHPGLYFRQLWPDSLVTACRTHLAAHANLSLYTTSMAADDLDDVRAALGYPKLLLFGGSYGTYFYLAYARQHPARVESIVLEGVAPPHFYRIPLPMARGAQTAIDDLEAACHRDAACGSHFPDFAAHFDAVAHRFDSGPVTVTVTNTATNRTQKVQLSKEVFADQLRHVMYADDAAYIAVTIERAYRGDYVPLAQMVDEQAQMFANLQANGLNLSVSCAEDIPFITQAAVSSGTTGTFQGDTRVRAQQRACRLWHIAAVPASFDEPVRSNAPILMISGSDDPASPPQYARDELPYLPNARIMLVPEASHDSDLPPCVDTTIAAFVRAHSASGLNFKGCVAEYHRPAFVTLAYDEAVPGENAAQGKRLRAVISGLFQGRIDRSQLTPAFSKEMPDAEVTGLAHDLKSIGDVKRVTYKGTRRSGKANLSMYFVRCVQGNVLVTFTLNASDRIQNLDVSAA